MKIKPMLAAKATDAALCGIFAKGPALTSVKLDGIRALVIDGQLVSRTLKPIRNMHTQKLFGHSGLNNLDGELIVGAANGHDVFNKTSSGVMSVEGTPEVTFYVFDDFTSPYNPFFERINDISNRTAVIEQECLRIVDQILARNMEDIHTLEQRALKINYEGIMVRRFDAPYKFGRSTEREGYLLKLKRFEDSEAVVLDIIQEQSKEGIGKGTLGAIRVQDIHTKHVFNIGTGFTKRERHILWSTNTVGRLAKYKFLNIGIKDLPRHPVFLGWRDEEDVS